jgi:hypothetical protein
MFLKWPTLRPPVLLGVHKFKWPLVVLDLNFMPMLYSCSRNITFGEEISTFCWVVNSKWDHSYSTSEGSIYSKEAVRNSKKQLLKDIAICSLAKWVLQNGVNTRCMSHGSQMLVCSRGLYEIKQMSEFTKLFTTLDGLRTDFPLQNLTLQFQ